MKLSTAAAEKILDLIDKEDLHFIEECCAYSGVSKPTFYALFPIESDEINAIKEKLQSRKSKNVHAVTRAWKDSDNPTLQIAYVKINSSDETRKKLSNTYIDKTDFNVNENGASFNITRTIISDDGESKD